MTHFLALVLVGGSEPDPVGRAHHLMLPFWARDRAEAPAAKCDGFTVGGTYDGIIHGEEREHGLAPA